MNQYETGKHHPDANTVMKLCEVLEVPAPFLYCEDDALAKVIAGFDRLSEEEQRGLLRLIEKVLPANLL